MLDDTERALDEHAEKIDKSEVTQLREKIASLREFLGKSTAGEAVTSAEIKQKVDELQMASLNLFDKMHRAQDQSANDNTKSTQEQEGEKKDDEEPKK